MTQDLADYLRFTLRETPPLEPLSRELQPLEKYLAVRQALFGERLECRVECDPASHAVAVPLAGGGGMRQIMIGDICWIEEMRNYSRVAISGVACVLLFRRRLAHWQADLPAGTFARLSKSLLVDMAMLEKSQWRSRDETLLTFRGRGDSIAIGRLPATRLREILGAPYR